MAMRRFELEDLVNRPGTYFNPQTEVLVVVDDSPELDAEIFNLEDAEGADWVLVSEESPIDEHVRDELLEKFQVRHTPAVDAQLEAEDEEEFDGFEVSHPDDEL
jgi:ABC-type Fe3+ transport system substrate-binding protein